MNASSTTSSPPRAAQAFGERDQIVPREQPAVGIVGIADKDELCVAGVGKLAHVQDADVRRAPRRGRIRHRPGDKIAARPGGARPATSGSKICVPGAGTTCAADGAPYARAAISARAEAAAGLGKRVEEFGRQGAAADTE